MCFISSFNATSYVSSHSFLLHRLPILHCFQMAVRLYLFVISPIYSIDPKQSVIEYHVYFTTFYNMHQV